jgi:hypothetical protein
MGTRSEHPLVIYLKLTDQSAARLARALGVHRSYIGHVIAGRRCPPDFITRLAEYTRIPRARLVAASQPPSEAA